MADTTLLELARTDRREVRRNGTAFHREGPPYQPCWGCIAPSVCPFPNDCAVYAAGATQDAPQ